MSTTQRKPMKIREITILAFLAVIAYVVMYLSKQIPVNVIGFLNFDLKDVIICIAGFLYGPLAVVSISVVVSIIEMVTISGTGPWGLLMNVLSTCSFICTAAWIYQRHRTIKGAVIGLITGALLMTGVMLLWNWLITPLYMDAGRDFIVTLLVPVFLPFNLIKAGINGTLTVLLYKPVVNALRKAKLVDLSSGSSGSGKSKLGIVLIASVLLITFILLALVLAGVI